MAEKTVGILALQGDYEAHRAALEAAGAHPVLVRNAADLKHIDGLILPGGESTTMLHLLHRQEMFAPLREFGLQKSVFGTCAGVILMAKKVTNPGQESLALMDLSVERNGYGRQIDSAVVRIEASAQLSDGSPERPIEGVFIRAPIIRKTGPGVRVLAEHGGNPVLVEEGRHLGATFHPELSGDPRIHQLFLSKL